MLQYIFSQIASSLSYILCIFFINNRLIQSTTMTIMLHVDILILFLFFIYYKFFTSKKEKQKAKILQTFNSQSKKLQFLLFMPAIATSFFKAFLFDKIGVINSSVSDLIVPIIVSISCLVIFKEKLEKNHLKLMFIACVGFVISIYQSMSIENTKLLIFYIIFKSMSDLIVRFYCKKRDSDLQAIFAENLIFAIFGFIFLVCFYKIDIQLLLNPFVFIVAIICHIHHILQAKGVRSAKFLSIVEFSKFLKVGINAILAFIFLSTIPQSNQIIGLLIIVIAFLKYSENRKQLIKAWTNET